MQDTRDQRGAIKDYTVYDHEIRTGRNVKQIILRAAQIARSEPQGPAYLIASRECLEETIEPYEVDAKLWQPIDPSALSARAVSTIGEALLSARLPVVVTTYLGREPEAVKELVKLCEAAGIAVVVMLFAKTVTIPADLFQDALPSHLNFPHNHDLYMGK